MVPLLVVALLVAVLDWIAVARGWKRVEYFAKPAVMVLLLGGLVFQLAIQGWQPLPLLLFTIGIFFSLLGDVALLAGSDRWFMAGLAAFLLTHLAYLAGLSIPLPDVSPLFSLAIAVVLAIAAARVLRRIISGILKQGQRGMVTPVAIYGIVITLMLLAAFLTLYSPHWNSLAAVLVALGAMLFYFSDIVLAWNKFVTPLKNGQLFTMILYNLGQIAIVAGVFLQFGK